MGFLAPPAGAVCEASGTPAQRSTPFRHRPTHTGSASPSSTVPVTTEQRSPEVRSPLPRSCQGPSLILTLTGSPSPTDFACQFAFHSGRSLVDDVSLPETCQRGIQQAREWTAGAAPSSGPGDSNDRRGHSSPSGARPGGR